MSIVHPLDPEGPAIFGCAQRGCRECLEALIKRHEGLVHVVLQRQKRGGVNYADLAQEGRIAVWQAVLHFDAQRGVTFSTYAGVAIKHRIWSAIARAKRPQGWQELQQPDARALAEERVWRSQVRSELEEALERLPEHWRQVVVAAYGLDGHAPRTLTTLGRHFGVSREAVRQWRNHALLLLRLPAIAGRLRTVCEQNSRASYVRSQALNRAWLRQYRGRGKRR
jgi:RNA polymerase sigma factor (sigma-70 family)